MELSDDGSFESRDLSATSAHFFVTAIGASAGGLEALEQLLGGVQAGAMAYVVMQHLSPGHHSALPEILARCTHLDVLTVVDGVEIKPSVVYVAPPGVEVTAEDAKLRCRNMLQSERLHPIDSLFRSVAAAYGASAIGVVLSGAGSDGSSGLRAIKEADGITFAQEPMTAAIPSMPQSALETGAIDFCLAPAGIAAELTQLATQPNAVPGRSGKRFSQEVLSQLFELLNRAWSVDFSAYKLSTVQRRIERRMALQHVEQPTEYLRLVQENAGELRALYDDLLIGVTGFFRDQEPFETLKSTVFPKLLEKRSIDVPVRVWVPGCATGEEAYSLVICLLEYIEAHRPGQRIQVFATDIDERALAKARQGVYPQGIEMDVSPERLHRFFARADKGYQISRKLRDLVVFARHNLGRDPPFSRLDLVSCRNVLIYLQPALQRKVMRVFHYSLNSRGCLLLGTAESVGDASDLFSLVERKLKIYVKKSVASLGIFDFAFASRQDLGAVVMSTPPSERTPEFTLQQLADRKILDKYGPPGVLVDEQLNILQFRGQTGLFFAPSPGAATLSLPRLIRPELLIALKGAVQRVLAEGVQAQAGPVHLTNAQRSLVSMDVLPVESAQIRCLLVLFHEIPQTQDNPSASEVASDASTEPEPFATRRVQELERDLVATKEYLETIIQELATSNEELQSSNEELQSSNEELQSTNEELETSKEELQATNEELVTVNEELQARITQLGIANDDLVNVLVNVGSPLLLVGLDLRIRRFSVAAEELLHLIPSDIGRPISYLGGMLNAPQIETSVSEAINSMRAVDLRVRCSDGRWYVMHSAPYRTADRAIRGVVIELNPVDTENKGIRTLPEFGELARKLLASLPHQVVVIDQSLRIVWANEGFLSAWSGKQLLADPLESTLPREARTDELWRAIENACFTGRPFQGVIAASRWGENPSQRLRWSANCIAAESDRGALTILMAEPMP